MIALDDNIADHPKFVGLSNDAFALWVRVIGYCRRHLTDGFIPAAAAHSLARSKAPRRTIDELTSPPVGQPDTAPLWVEAPGGYRVHDYLDWNPSRAQVEAKVEANRAKGRSGGIASGRSRNEAKANQARTQAEPSANPNRTQREPEPNQPRSQNEAACFAVGSTKTNPDPIRERSLLEASPETDTVRARETKPKPPPPPPQPPEISGSERSAGDDTLARIAAELAAHPALVPVADAEMANAILGRMIAAGRPVEAVLDAIREAAADASPGISEPRLRVMVRKYTDHARQRPLLPQKGPANASLRSGADGEPDPRDAHALERRKGLAGLAPPSGLVGRIGGGQ